MGDPSLRLKNGCAQDDAEMGREFKLSHYQTVPHGSMFLSGMILSMIRTVGCDIGLAVLRDHSENS